MITHCCYSKQLNELYTRFDRTLRTLGTAIEQEVLVEPEITLSVLVSWLIWETPSATITLHVNSLTPTLVDTLNSLYKRDNVSVGRPRRPLIESLTIHLPAEQMLTSTCMHFARLHPEVQFITTPYGPEESLTLTSDQPRRQLPVINSVRGELSQEVGTRMRKLTFRSEEIK